MQLGKGVFFAPASGVASTRDKLNVIDFQADESPKRENQPIFQVDRRTGTCFYARSVAVKLSRAVADGFDAVAAGVDQESSEVVFVVLGPVAWCTVVSAVMQ